MLFLICSIPASASLFLTRGSFNASPAFFSSSVSSRGTMSSIYDGIPAFARCAAMPDPMTPDPSIVTLFI